MSKNIPTLNSASINIDHIPKELSDDIIKKFPLSANLTDYQTLYDTFNYDKSLTNEIVYYADGSINVAYNTIDRHLVNGRKNKVAIYAIDKNATVKKYTYLDLFNLSNQVANALVKLGVKKGDRVFIFLPRIIETYTVTLALARIGAIAGPLFSAFGPDALKDRLSDSGAKILITDTNLKSRIDSIKSDLPNLESIVIVAGNQANLNANEYSFEAITHNESTVFNNAHMQLEDPLYILYTSGTTGKPKGVVHVHNDLKSQHMTTKWVLDLRDDDIYWCTADPGWVTGMVYGIYGPLSNGASMVCFESGFSAKLWYQTLQDLNVTVWYTSPTALRMLMKEGDALVRQYNLNSLRHILSVGEPLNPEVIRWGMQVFRLPIHDNWWQTETGAQMISNLPCLPIKPGSMGKPLPGIYAAIVDDEGNELEVGHLGKLVVKPNWPSMFRTVWRDPERYNEYFKITNWYFTGDNAWIDTDGYFWFVGRADDVINTAGHRVGPFEVESALLEHEYVVEAGVIGIPDEERGEIIKAFIVLKDGIKANEEILKNIKDFIKKQLAFHAYPREIEVRSKLPKTRSGKIMRRLLKAEELGLPLGDLTGLED